MKITMEQVKVLRAETGAGVMDCKKALAQANGNNKEAAELLRTVCSGFWQTAMVSRTGRGGAYHIQA